MTDITGTSASELLTGTNDPDLIQGLGGDDTLAGLSGQDTLDGGDGNDWADYSAGAFAGVYDLALDTADFAGWYTESILNIENILAGGGNDLIQGDNAENHLMGGAGNDTLAGMGGHDTLDGGDGTDWADYSAGAFDGVYDLNLDIAHFEGWYTEIISNIENIEAGGGNDLIKGDESENHLIGGAGDDTLIGNGSQDTLDGGDGIDWADYSVGNFDGVFDLALDTADFAGFYTESIFNIENLEAGGGNDLIQGDNAENHLIGGAGNDTLIGNGGHDTLDGGDGIDWADYSAGAFDGVYDLVAETAFFDGWYTETIASIENLIAGDGVDMITGSSGDNHLQGGGGNDTLYGQDGTDTLNGGDGDDVIYGGATEADLRDVVYAGTGNDSIDGGYGNDELRGDGGLDTIVGGYGVDSIFGGDGDDQLTGQAWSDLIFGGTGSDFINGGFGFDRVNGGTGADRFFHLGIADHGSDWIQDYLSSDGDVLQFGAAGTRDQFQVNFTETAGAGVGGVEEAFIIYRPTGQILWALVDGGAQSEINLLIGGVTYDLLS